MERNFHISGHEACPLWSRPPLFRPATWIQGSDDVLKWALRAVASAWLLLQVLVDGAIQSLQVGETVSVPSVNLGPESQQL